MKRILRNRIFRGLTLAFAIAVAIPVASAAARPMGDSPVVYGGGLVRVQTQSQAPQVAVSKFANSIANPYHLRKYHVFPARNASSAPIVSEKTAGLGLPSQPVALAWTVSSSPIVSEKTAGLGLSSQPDAVVSTPGSSFDWGDAGIGAGATTALIVAMLGGALLYTRRKHHGGTFAH